MRTKNAQAPKTTITAAQFEDAIARYAAAELHEAEINRQLEAEVNEIMEKYGDELGCIGQAKQAAYDIAHMYCAVNKETLFGKRRSIGTPDGVAGFRLSTPRLCTVKGNTWQKVVEKLKEKLPGYVRITYEPAKDMLLADRYKEHVAPMLAELGVRIVQEELFYIESRKAA